MKAKDWKFEKYIPDGEDFDAQHKANISTDLIGLLGDSGQERIRKVLLDLYKKHGVRRLIDEATATIHSLANDKYTLSKKK